MDMFTKGPLLMTWAIIDCESTGIDPGSRLIELAAVLIDDVGVEYDRFVASAILASLCRQTSAT